MKISKLSVLALFVFASFTPVVGFTSAKSVHGVEQYDIENNSFSSSSNWDLSTNKAFSTESAEFTNAMVTDGHLTFDHNRTLNSQTSILWSNSNSTSDHSYATGQPDNYVAVSSGPEIILGGFQYSGMESYEIISMSIVLAFNVPDPLYSDSVRISIEVGGMNTLVKEFSHTQQGLFYMTSPYWSKDITNENYSWSDLGMANVKVDYASVGGTDDSEMRLDALGFQVTYVSPWFGVETAVAKQMIFSGKLPVIELNTTLGNHTGISQSPCGIEKSIDGEGVWSSEVVSRPHGQSWGRLHVTTTGDSNWTVYSSNDLITWESTNVSVGELVPNHEYLRVEGKINSGCISSVRLDVNDPSMIFDWQIGESLDGIDQSSSWLEAKVRGQEVFRADLDSIGSENVVVPIGEHLPTDTTNFEISFGIVFAWSSDGQPSSTVVQVDSMKITGGYSIEWDEDPNCLTIGDVNLFEDGVGRLIPVLNTCTDDRAANSELSLSVSQNNPDVVSVGVVGDQIRISQNDESSGETIVTATVTDPAGNFWEQSFVVSVSSVNDPPVFVGDLPTTVIVSLGQSSSIEMDFDDPDSSGVSVVTSYSWASWNQQSGVIELNPTVPGDYDLQITISDGELNVSRNINIEVKSSADLVVENISIIGELKSGNNVEILVYVRNQGYSDAYFVNVQCFTENYAKLVSIAEIKSGTVESIVCPWVVPMDSEMVTLDIELDNGNDVFESDEDNNNYSTTVSVELLSDNEAVSVESSSSGLGQTFVWGGTLLAVLLIVGLFIAFGPAPVRKIK